MKTKNFEFFFSGCFVVVQTIHKRRVAMAKAQGNISKAIEWLNKYVET